MPWLQLAVCVIEEGFVGTVRVEGRSSDIIVDPEGDGCFIHSMLLILGDVGGTHLGHGGVVEACGGHGGSTATRQTLKSKRERRDWPRIRV